MHKLKKICRNCKFCVNKDGVWTCKSSLSENYNLVVYADYENCNEIYLCSKKKIRGVK